MTNTEKDVKSVKSTSNPHNDDKEEVSEPGHTIEHFLLGGNRWSRMKRFASVSVLMFLGFLFLNALFVFYSLYRLSKITMDQVNIFVLQVDRLCDEQAEIRLRLGFQDVMGLEVLGVEFDKPVQLSFTLPSVHSNPIANVTIPAFSFGYERQELDFAEDPIIVNLNEHFPYQVMMDHLREELMLDIELFASFKTTSFIVPIRMARSFSFSIPINRNIDSTTASSNLLTLDRINFVDDTKRLDISVETLIGVKPGLVPHFLSIIAPELSMDIYKMNAIGASPELLSTITSPAQTINNASPHVKVQMTLENSNRIAIVDSIKRVLKRDEGLLFSIQSSFEDAQKCKLQRILANVSMQVSLGELLTMNHKPAANKVQSRRSQTVHKSQTRSGPVAKLAFKGGVNEQTISMSSTFDSDYFMGLAGLSSTRVVGRFPPVSLSLILEHGLGSQSRNDTLTTLEVAHSQANLHNHFLFDINVQLIDGERLIKALTRVGQVERQPHLVHPELRPYKRVILTGTPNGSLMSAIVSIFELQMRFSNGQIEFTNDLFQDFHSGMSTSGPVLVDFLAPERIDHAVKHSVSVKARQDQSTGAISFTGDLQKEAVMPNPVLELAWEKIKVSANYKLDKLFNLIIEDGKLRCSLAPLRPSLLLHQGRIAAQFLIDGSERISELLEELRDGSQFARVDFSGSIGDKPIKLSTALPPLSAISTTAMGLEQDKQTEEQNEKGVKTHTRLVGMKGSRMQMVVDLGKKTFCAPPNAHFGSIIDLDVELPRLNTNICMFRVVDNLGCFAQVKTLPVKVTAQIVDAEICGVQSRMVTMDEFESGLERQPVQTLFTEIVNRPDSDNNWLPLDMDVYDYKKAFEAMDAMYEDVEVPYTLAPGQDKNRPIGFGLDKFFNSLSTIATYRLNFPTVSLPDHVYDQISVLPESMPMITTIDVWSPSRQSLRGEMTIKIPKEAGYGASTTDCHAKVIEWGPVEMELKATDTDWFRMSMTEARIFMSSAEENCPASTDTFTVSFELHSGIDHLNSGDLRRAMHHLVTNHLDKEADLIKSMLIGERRIKMSARVGEFQSPTEFKSIMSKLKLKTLVQWGHVAFAKYKYGKPSGLPTDWTVQMKLEGLPQVAQNKTITEDVIPFPCFFNKPCGDLIYAPSPRSHLAKAEIKIDSLIQRLFDVSINTVGRMFNKLNWQRYPTAGAMTMRLHDPIFLTATLNADIDIAEVMVPPLTVNRHAAIDNPSRGSEKRVFAKRAKLIQSDTHLLNVYVRVPKYYHDLSGLFAAIDFDPIVRVELEAPPQPDMYYSPLSMTLSNERIVESNLLSSIGCVVIEEIATGAMPSILGASEVEKSVTAPITNEQLIEVHIENMFLPNPTSIMSILFDKPILAEYEYKGKVFGRGRVEPMLFKPGMNKVSVKAHLTKDCFGRCSAESESVKEDMGRFLAGAALGSAIDLTAVAHVAPGLSLAIPFKHPHRLVPLAVFDAEASLEAFAEHGIRTVNALDPVFSGRPGTWWSWLTRWSGKATAVASQRTHQRPEGTWREAVMGRFWQWWYGDDTTMETSTRGSQSQTTMSEQDERGWFQWARQWWSNYWQQSTDDQSMQSSQHHDADGNQNNSHTHGTVQGTTRGRSNYDLNIPICLRNDADIEMRLFGLYLNIAFDDTDGFYFTRDTDRSLIRNTMYMAQQDCQPPSSATPFHRDAFLKCIKEHPAGPASVLHARSSLAGRKAVMTPIPISRQFVARVFDEAVNHDGPCLRITADSFISVGLSNGQGRDDQFTMNIPLDMWKDLEMNPFGDACGTRSQCLCKQNVESTKLSYYRPDTDSHDTLQSNDTFHLHNQQLWFKEQLSVFESWQIDFAVDFEWASSMRMSGGSLAGGLALVMQQNSGNVTIMGDTMFGYHQIPTRLKTGSRPHLADDDNNYHNDQQGKTGHKQPLDKSLAILFEPHTIDDRPLAQRTVSNLPYLYWKGAPPNAISFLQNGLPNPLRVPNPRALSNATEQRKELLLKKINGVFPPYDTKLRFTVVHNAGERQVYVYGRGEERSPTHHSIFPVDLQRLLPHSNTFWFGFTGKADGSIRDWTVHSISVKHIQPDIHKTRIFWPNAMAPKPRQPGMFWLQLRDECDRVMAMAHGELQVKLTLIDSMHPRQVIKIRGDEEPDVKTTRQSGPDSLLWSHRGMEVMCRVEFDVKRRLYKVHYDSPVPGRFAINVSTLDRSSGRESAWNAVKWHTILVRPYF